MPLSSRTSVQARETIQRAYKELESAVSVPDASRFRETTIEDVQKTCQILENELGARGLLRNMGRLEPLLKGLECYGKVVDTLCQGTPFLPWIWAPIVTILKIGSDCINAFETLIKAYAKIGQSLTRFESLRRTFDNDAAFQDIVAVFYRDIVKFHGCAYKFVTANGWKTFFRTIWGRFERQFHAILESLDRHAELIDKEANARNIADTQRLLKQLETESKSRLEKARSEENAQIAQYYQDIVARLQVNEADQVSIWETLVGAIPGGESTCDWVLRHAKISSWLSITGTTYSLWIQGTAGTGKSVIAAHLARFRSANNDIVVRHFCNDLYDSSMKYDQILKSVIRQLAEQSDDAIAYMHDVLRTDRKPLTASALERVAGQLITLISGSQKDVKGVWIIIDGIDICELADLTRCVGWLDSITTRDKTVGAGSCKVLFTSRREPPKKNARHRSLVTLGEEANSVKESIRHYTGRRLQLSPIAERLSQLGLDSEAVAQLASEISGKSDGMFLYARLIIDYLTKQLFRTSEELKDALHELPPELKGFYHKIVSNILSHLSPASIESVRCVLQWVGFSAVPLKKVELLSAVTFTLGDENADRLVPSFFLHDCFALLEEKPDKTIAYLHATVKDFLLDTESPLSLNRDSIKRQLTLGTLTCLSAAAKVFGPHSNAQSARLLTVRGVFAFLNYSSKHWIEYVFSYAEDCYKNGKQDAEFENVINSLAHELREVQVESGFQNELMHKGLHVSDARAEYLQCHPAILPAMQAALVSQTEVLDPSSNIATSSPCQVNSNDDGVAVILKQYQEAVLWVLTQGYFLGVSKEDFELFKTQAQTLLYTCRLPSCPRSSIGFETEADISAHELEHSRHYHCQAEGCQFPSFSSFYLLEKHRKKHHQQHAEKRKLRRVNSIALSASAPFAKERTLLKLQSGIQPNPIEMASSSRQQVPPRIPPHQRVINSPTDMALQQQQQQVAPATPHDHHNLSEKNLAHLPSNQEDQMSNANIPLNASNVGGWNNGRYPLFPRPDNFAQNGAELTDVREGILSLDGESKIPRTKIPRTKIPRNQEFDGSRFTDAPDTAEPEFPLERVNLDEYEIQLMLLKQENLKRRMLARAEQDGTLRRALADEEATADSADPVLPQQVLRATDYQASLTPLENYHARWKQLGSNDKELPRPARAIEENKAGYSSWQAEHFNDYQRKVFRLEEEKKRRLSPAWADGFSRRESKS